MEPERRKKVIRILVIEGDESWVDRTLENSALYAGGTFVAPGRGVIREVYRTELDLFLVDEETE